MGYGGNSKGGKSARPALAKASPIIRPSTDYKWKKECREYDEELKKQRDDEREEAAAARKQARQAGDDVDLGKAGKYVEMVGTKGGKSLPINKVRGLVSSSTSTSSYGKNTDWSNYMTQSRVAPRLAAIEWQPHGHDESGGGHGDSSSSSWYVPSAKDAAEKTNGWQSGDLHTVGEEKWESSKRDRDDWQQATYNPSQVNNGSSEPPYSKGDWGEWSWREAEPDRRQDEGTHDSYPAGSAPEKIHPIVDHDLPLCQMDFNGWGLDDSGLGTQLEMITQLIRQRKVQPCVRIIDLRSNKFTDSGVAVLVHFLNENDIAVTELLLNGNPLTEPTALHDFCKRQAGPHVVQLMASEIGCETLWRMLEICCKTSGKKKRKPPLELRFVGFGGTGITTSILQGRAQVFNTAIARGLRVGGFDSRSQEIVADANIHSGEWDIIISASDPVVCQ